MLGYEAYLIIFAEGWTGSLVNVNEMYKTEYRGEVFRVY